MNVSAAAPPPSAPGPAATAADELAGALFLAGAALEAAGLPTPVTASAVDRVLVALLAEGLQREEVLAVLPHLPLAADAEADLRRLAVRLPD